MLNQLQENDYKLLESYWLNFQELANSESTNENRKRNIENIMSAIETLYNASNGIERGVIELGYFDSTEDTLDSRYIAEQLNVTVSKVNRLRESLMKDTAKLIGWI